MELQQEIFQTVTLLKMRGFKKSNFGNFHPGGNLGKDLVNLLLL